jgi:hypothetical protein
MANKTTADIQNLRGKIGIGTNNPLDTLHVNGTFRIGSGALEDDIFNIHQDSSSGIITTYRNNTGGVINRIYADYDNDGTIVEYQERVGWNGNYSEIGNYSNHPFYIHTNNATRMTISSSGNVGIGETSPSNRLHIKHNSNAATGILVENSLDNDGTNDSDAAAQISFQVASNNGYLRVHGSPTDVASEHQIDLGSTASGSFLTFSPSGSEKVRIDSSGNVGIGKTDPSAPLHINGGSTNQVIKIQSNSAPYIRFKEGGTDVGFIQFGTDTYISNQKDGTLNFRTNNTDKMTILSNGRVGIGITNPAGLLHVYGGRSYFAPAGDSDSGTSSHVIDIYNPHDTAFTANALTAYNAHTSWDIGSRSSYTISSRPNNASLYTFAGEHATAAVAVNRYVQFNSNNDNPLLNWTFYQYDGSGTAATDLKVPNKVWTIQSYQSGGSDTLLILSGDGSLQLSQYGAGYLKTDASGNVTVDTSTIEDTLDSVADRGNTTDQTLIFPQSYKDTDTANVTDDNWYRVINMNGSAGRGACEFAFYSGGGTRSPFSCRGAVSTSYGNSGSIITVYHNGHSSAIKAIRVTRNSGNGTAFVDIKTYTDDGVIVYIEAGAVSTSAITVDFTDVTTLPSGDAVETELDIDGKSFGTTSSSSAGEFSIERDGQAKVYRKLTLQEDKSNAETVYIQTNSRGGGTDDADLRIGNSNNGDVLTVHNANVGIGTTGPSDKLHIQGSTANIRLVDTSYKSSSEGQTAPKITFHLGGSSAEQSPSIAEIRTFDDYDGGAYEGSMAFYTMNGSIQERMRITSGGDVGIGTTNPSSKLHVEIPTSNDGSRQEIQRWVNTAQNSVSLFAYGGSTDLIQIGAWNAEQNIAIVTEALSSISATTAKGIYIKSGGNVGIGTTDPSTLLHVYKSSSNPTLLAEFENPSGQAIVRIASKNDVLGILEFGDSEDGNPGAIQYDHSGNSMRFKTNDSEKLRIASNGSLDFKSYGAGSFKGSNLYTLGVDSSGTHSLAATGFTFFGVFH